MSDKIKTIKTFQVSEITDKQKVLTSLEERDPEGNILTHILYDEAGEVAQKTENAFDEKGRMISEKQYTGSEYPDQHIVFEYNESGKVGRAVVHYSDGSKSFRNYSRDEANNITTIEIVDENNAFEGKEIRKFDSEGRVLEATIFDEDNHISEKTETEYDDHGRIIENVVLDSEGYETVRFYDYYNDDEGRINKIEVLNEDEVIIRVDEIFYDEKGNQSKYIVLDKSRGLTFSEVWEYDQHDQVVNHKRLRGDQLLEEVKSKYRTDNLIEEQETLTGDGLVVNYFEYSFH